MIAQRLHPVAGFRPQPAQFGDMRAAAQRLAEISHEAAHVGAGPAFDVQAQLRSVAVEQIGFGQQFEGMHIDTIPAPQREALEEIFRAQDIDTQRMRDTYVARWAWDVWAFPEFARLREPPAPRTFKREQKGLFF